MSNGYTHELVDGKDLLEFFQMIKILRDLDMGIGILVLFGIL